MQDDKFKEELTPEQYEVLRNKGTERPFSGKLLHNKETGTYMCAACGNELFSSDTKFESGSGWPSFTDVKKNNSVKLIEDNTNGMQRIEVVCSNCDSHLGHVFDDGPGPIGKRFCINSLSLDFKQEK